MFSAKLVSLVVLGSLVAANPWVQQSAVHIFVAKQDLWRLERRTATNVFPTPPTTSSLSKPITIAVGQTFTPPQAYTRYDRGSGACKGQTEGGDSDAVFLLQEGATLSRVVIGANQAEGVHCLGKLPIFSGYVRPILER